MKSLPFFKYHPDPLATGMIEKKEIVCECCEKPSAYAYAQGLYSIRRVEFICPWCIADGSAAQKFEGEFVDAHPLCAGHLEPSIIEEVSKRTPGYISWQGDVWQVHCNDACEFHGDAHKHDLEALTGESLQEFLTTYYMDEEFWDDLKESYKKGGDPAIYKFKCRHCAQLIYTMDFS